MGRQDLSSVTTFYPGFLFKKIKVHERSLRTMGYDVECDLKRYWKITKSSRFTKEICKS